MIEKAINKWVDKNNKPIALSKFCKVVGIPYKTFVKYVNKGGTRTEKRVLGTVPGKSMILCPTNQLYVAEVLVQKD